MSATGDGVICQSYLLRPQEEVFGENEQIVNFIALRIQKNAIMIIAKTVLFRGFYGQLFTVRDC